MNRDELDLKGAAWIAAVVATVVAWIVALLMQDPGAGLVDGGGAFSPFVVLVISGAVFVSGVYYYLVEGGSLAQRIKGISITGGLAFLIYGLLSVDFGVLLGGTVVKTMIFILMGLLVLLVTLIDLQVIVRKMRGFPLRIYRWDGASWVDVVIGLGSGVLFAASSYFLGFSLIGTPVGLVPSSIAGANVGSALLVASVALIENALIISLPLGFFMAVSGFLSHRATGSEGRSQVVSVLVGVVASVFVVIPVAYIFHLGAYGNQAFTLVSVAMLFGAWSLMTVFRGGCSLAMDLSHMSYNFLVVIFQVAYVGITLL